MNWKHIQNLMNVYSENFQSCKLYLNEYTDTEMAESVRKLLYDVIERIVFFCYSCL